MPTIVVFKSFEAIDCSTAYRLDNEQSNCMHVAAGYWKGYSDGAFMSELRGGNFIIDSLVQINPGQVIRVASLNANTRAHQIKNYYPHANVFKAGTNSVVLYMAIKGDVWYKMGGALPNNALTYTGSYFVLNTGSPYPAPKIKVDLFNINTGTINPAFLW